MLDNTLHPTIELNPLENQKKIHDNLLTGNLFLKLSFFATVLAFVVVILGAYTRLTDAGLGCPDWPGCYGKLIVYQIEKTNHEVNVTKAWTEMSHRYLAGLLGMVILALGIVAIRNRHIPEQSVMLPLFLVVLVVFQALLGMWTVTLKLLPTVVMAHLLGGLTTLALLWLLTLKLYSLENLQIKNSITFLKYLAGFALLILTIQIFLGGWTSANYAALVCLDFPGCQGFYFSTHSLIDSIRDAFNFVEPLDHFAKINVHMLHRIGACMTAFVLGWLALLSFIKIKSFRMRMLSVTLAILLAVQILLGVTNVLAILPLPVAVAHNAVAALLLLNLVAINYWIASSLNAPRNDASFKARQNSNLIRISKTMKYKILEILKIMGISNLRNIKLYWNI